MSKFDTVKKALHENNHVVIVNLNLQNYFPHRNGYFTQTADFWIAPKSGLYTADALQGFMMGLISGLEPTCKDDFHQYKDDTTFNFGKLYFDEKIGEERVVQQVTHAMFDPEFLRTFDVTDDGKVENVYGLNPQGELVRNTDKITEHLRRTWVRPFPTAQFAKDVLEQRVDGEYSTQLSVLNKYKPNPLRRIAGLLGAER